MLLAVFLFCQQLLSSLQKWWMDQIRFQNDAFEFCQGLNLRENLQSLTVEVLAGCLKVEKPDPTQWLPFHNAFRLRSPR